MEEVVREVHIVPMKRVWKKQAIPQERVQCRTMQSVHVVDVLEPSGVKQSVVEDIVGASQIHSTTKQSW